MCNTYKIIELKCNVDDMTGEAVAYALERFFEGGALDAYTTPIGMKKNRPGILITVTSNEDTRERLIADIFKYTTTIGVRESEALGHALFRNEEYIETPSGNVRCKTSTGFGVERRKYEHEDIAKIARESGMSLAETVEVVKKYDQK